MSRLKVSVDLDLSRNLPQTLSKLIMKLRSFLYPLAVGVSVLLIVVGGFFWYTSSTPVISAVENTPKNPTTAIFVSKQTPLMVSLLGNPNRMEELRELEETLVAPLDLNYRQDVQSWVGDEMTLAVTSLDLDRNPDNAIEPGYLLAFTANDIEKAKAALQVLYSRKAIAGQGDLVFEPYEGVTLTYKRPLSGMATGDPHQPGKILTSAVVANRFILFANHPKVLRDAINNVQALDLNLANDPEYQKMLPTLTKDRLGLSFVNIPNLAAWISEQFVPLRDSFNSSQTLAIAFSVDGEGLLVDTAILGAKASEETIAPLLTEPVAALQYIPGESTLAIAGNDLNKLWDSLSTESGDEDILKSLLNRSLNSWQSLWGIELPEDIFNWVAGEYALSLLPHPDGVNTDWIFVAQKVESANPEAAIKNIDEIAQQQGLNTSTLPFGDRTLSVWTQLIPSTVENSNETLLNLEAKVQGFHTEVGNYEIFTNSIEAMDKALKGMDKSLLQSETFMNAIAPLPFNNNGYLYLDWPNSKAFIEHQLPLMRVVELVGEPLLTDLHTLAISSYGIDTGVQRSKLFFHFFERERD